MQLRRDNKGDVSSWLVVCSHSFSNLLNNVLISLDILSDA